MNHSKPLGRNSNIVRMGMIAAYMALVIALLWSLYSGTLTCQEKIHREIDTMLDTYSLFVPNYINDSEQLHAKTESFIRLHNTIDTLNIVAPHGKNSWRIHYSYKDAQTGSVTSQVQQVVWLAYHDPTHAFTEEMQTNPRLYVTARAITGVNGVDAVAVITQHISTDAIRALGILSIHYILCGVFIISGIFALLHIRRHE